VIAESVVVDLPRPRQRADIIHHPNYYKIRNYLVDFLIKRSKTIVAIPGHTQFPKTVNPTHDEHEHPDMCTSPSIHIVNA
jgi:nitrate/nitrite transport system ATP-binding protein